MGAKNESAARCEKISNPNKTPTTSSAAALSGSAPIGDLRRSTTSFWGKAPLSCEPLSPSRTAIDICFIVFLVPVVLIGLGFIVGADLCQMIWRRR